MNDPFLTVKEQHVKEKVMAQHFVNLFFFFF